MFVTIGSAAVQGLFFSNMELLQRHAGWMAHTMETAIQLRDYRYTLYSGKDVGHDALMFFFAYYICDNFPTIWMR